MIKWHTRLLPQEVAEDQPAVQLTAKDFRGKWTQTGARAVATSAFSAAYRQPAPSWGSGPMRSLTVSGIGCSSNLPGYFNAYGMHTLHGRALAVATGAKLAKSRTDRHRDRWRWRWLRHRRQPFHPYGTPERRSHLFVMNNQIYGLTTGQLSPTSCSGDEDQEHTVWQCGVAGQSDYGGDYERGHVCRPRL